MRKGFPLFAVLLIVVGMALLLDRSNVLAFGWWTIFWAVIAVAGAFKIYHAFRWPSEGGMVWGSIFFFVGLYNVLEDFTIVLLPDGALFPAFLVVAGFGFLLALLRQPREWHLAVPAVVLLGFGTIMVLAETGRMGQWFVMDMIRQWWPLALVLFGAALLLNRGVARKPSAQ
jgi:hypothetical protein